LQNSLYDVGSDEITKNEAKSSDDNQNFNDSISETLDNDINEDDNVDDDKKAAKDGAEIIDKDDIDSTIEEDI
jgi:hypothetical protein